MPAHDPELSRAAVQTLFVSARAWDVTALLRELKESTGRWQKVKLENFILGLLEFGKAGPALGLKLTIEGGRVDLSTSGIETLDKLLGGGIERGTSCLFLGPSGAGKSSLAAQFAVSAAARGEKVLMLLFEETLRVAMARAHAIGMPLQQYVDSGHIAIRQLDPGELVPGQFVNLITSSVENEKVKVVLVDSLNGYLQAMPDVRFLNIQLHELLTFLSHRGIVTLFTVAQQGILGAGMSSPIDLTYLADSVLLLRYFEQSGEIKKAVSVLKKRIGKHETTIRQILTDAEGIRVGEVLRDFQGVLTGSPVYKGTTQVMMKKR